MLLLLDKNFYPLMKIILVHSIWSKNKKIPWLYFGSSYLKMKIWEKKLLGKRINIQKEIHFQAAFQKESFLQWIENQRVENNDSIFWWMTHIAGRNNAYSNFYLNLCQLFAIKSYLRKEKKLDEIVIVCENIFLLKFLLNNLSKEYKSQFSPLVNFYWIKDLLFFLNKGLISQFKQIYNLTLHYFFAKFTRPKDLVKPSGDISLFHHCLDNTNSFNNNNLACKYFTILPDWLRKKNIRVFSLPWLFKNKPSIKFYKNLRNTDCFIPEDWLTLKDYFIIFKNSIRSINTLSYKIPYPEIKINYLVLHEKFFQLTEVRAFFWRYIPSIKKWSTEVKSLTVYDQYENMPFEHSIRYIIKKLPMKSTSIGFYHSLVTKEFMAYHHLQSEWNSSIKPDYVACMGKISENLLIDQGVPKQKILSVAALRQLKHENELENKKNRKQILILLSMSLDASAEVLTKVYLNNHVITDELNLKVRVKLHPMVKIKNLLKKINWNKLPADWELADKDLYTELKDSFCTISMFTASVYDAILSKNIAISLMSDLNLMDNYLDLFSNKYPLAQSVQEQAIASKLRDVFTEKTAEHQEEFLKIRRELIAGINVSNEKNLDAFIPKN